MDLFFSISLLTVSAIVSSTIILLFFYRYQIAPQTPITILKPYPILGNLPHFFNNRHRILDWITDLLAASPTGTITVAPFVITADPTVVEHIASTRFATYQKGHTVATLQDLLGHGIFNSDGDTWHLQRKIASFEFNTTALRSFLHDAIRRELDTGLLPLLARSARTGSVLELHDILKRFAFDNICSLAFGTDLAVLDGGGTEDSEQFYHAFDDAVHLSIYRWSYHFHWMWKLRRWLNTGSEYKLRVNLAAVRL